MCNHPRKSIKQLYNFAKRLSYYGKESFSPIKSNLNKGVATLAKPLLIDTSLESHPFDISSLTNSSQLTPVSSRVSLQLMVVMEIVLYINMQRKPHNNANLFSIISKYVFCFVNFHQHLLPYQRWFRVLMNGSL